MTLIEKIQKCSNMVDISSIILSDVWVHYSVKFAKEYRPFVRDNEQQQDWVNAVNSTLGEQIKAERVNLFKTIPPRFDKTRIYNELKNKIAKYL